MAWDFETDPEFQEKLDWVDAVRARGDRAARPAVPAAGVHATRRRARSASSTRSSNEVRDQRPVGLPPRPRARRQGLRPAQARAAERDPRPVELGADDLRLPGPRHRQRRDHRPLRHRRAEGASTSQPLLDGEMLLVLLDDRAPRRRRPDACSPPGPCATATSGSSTAGSASRRTPARRRSSSSWRSPTPTSSAYQGMSMFLVPTDTPGVEHRPQRRPRRRARGRGQPRPHPLRRRARAGRRPARRRGPGLRHRADPPRRRPHPPRDAHDRRCATRRFDMMCERALQPRRRKGSLLADKQFVQGYIADSYVAARAVPAAGAAHRLEDRQVQRLHAGAQGHRRGQGARCRRCCTTSRSAPCRSTARSACRTRCRSSGCGTLAPVMGLADGPTEVHKVTVARQVLRDYRPSDDLWPTEHLPKTTRGGAGEVRRAPRARGGQPVSDGSGSSATWRRHRRRRRPRRVDGRREACPARASRSRRASSPAARQNEIFEIRRGDLQRWRCASRRRRRPRRRDERHPARVAHHRGARRHRRAAHRGGRGVRRPERARPDLLPDGLRRRLVADGQPATAGRRRSTPTSRPAPAWPTSSSTASRMLSKVDWQARGLEDLGRPDGFHERQVDRWTAFLERIKGRELPGFDEAAAWLRGPPAASTSSRASCTATTSSPTSCTATARRPGWRRSSTGRWARSATPSSTSPGWCRAGPRTPTTPRRGRLRRPARHAVARRRCSRDYAEVSGRQVDDIDYYVVLARWKLAVVLEQGFQRAGDDPKLQAFGAVVLDLMARAAELAESTDYDVRA